MRTTCLALAALLLATAAYAGMQNRAAQRATERYEAAVERAETDYATAMQRATEQYRTELERAMQGAMRAGNAEEVEEIRGVLAGLEEGEEDRDTSLAGTQWRSEYENVHFRPDGTVVRDSVPDDVGEWRMRGNRDAEVIFRSGKAPRWRITFSQDGTRFMSVRYTPAGQVIASTVHERIADSS